MLKLYIFCLLFACSIDTHAQNKFYIISGVNRLIPNHINDKGFEASSGGYGFMGGFGVLRKVKRHAFALEMNFESQRFDFLSGYFMFPEDLPPSIGSRFEMNYRMKNINISPIFNFNIISKKLYIPISLGFQKTFSKMTSTLTKGDGKIVSTNFFYYHPPDFNITINTGLIYYLNPNGNLCVFFSPRYTFNLIPINAVFSGYKDKRYSAISLLVGLQI